ncbi:MAG: glycosyltransferase family 2 protein [Lentisphaerae bacterium]|nr:glycosyltransferase family 2 protein [Lentisphaerota bacterium]
MSKALISVVVPAFNERANVAPLLARLASMAGGETGYDWEFVFVDDGSGDGTADAVADAAAADRRVKLLQFTRNFGHQMALTAGLGEARGRAVVSLDADLQHPPETVPAMLRRWEAGAKVVAGLRGASGAGAAKDRASRLFYWLINHLTEIPIPAGAADFRLMDREVVDAFLRMGERARFIRGMVSWMGFPVETAPYAEERRAAGRSKYSLTRMLCLAADAVTSFSALPLRFATVAGLATTLIAALYAAYVLFVFLFVPRVVIPGWASIVLVALFLGGIQLLFLGVIGEYLHRIYAEVKGRPLYLVKRRIGLADDGSGAGTQARRL